MIRAARFVPIARTYIRRKDFAQSRGDMSYRESKSSESETDTNSSVVSRSFDERITIRNNHELLFPARTRENLHTECIAFALVLFFLITLLYFCLQHEILRFRDGARSKERSTRSFIIDSLVLGGAFARVRARARARRNPPRRCVIPRLESRLFLQRYSQDDRYLEFTSTRIRTGAAVAQLCGADNRSVERPRCKSRAGCRATISALTSLAH